MKKDPFLFLNFVLIFHLSINSQVDTTYQTENSTITIKTNKHSGRGYIKEEFVNEDFILWKSFNKEGYITYEKYTDSSEIKQVGIAKSYSAVGKLKYIIDHDRKSWRIIDTSVFPHHEEIYVAKFRADSILTSLYGEAFFRKNIEWNIIDSDYFVKESNSPNYPISWLKEQSLDLKPSEFVLSYNINFNEVQNYSHIQILIDGDGNILREHIWNNTRLEQNFGLEKDIYIDSTSNILSVDKAVLMAKEYGYKEQNKMKVKALVTWVETPSSSTEVYSGHWRIYVVEYIKNLKEKSSLKTGKTKRKFQRICNVYVFNPWSNEFLGKEKLVLDSQDDLSYILFDDHEGSRDIFESHSEAPPISYDPENFKQLKSKNRYKLNSVWKKENGNSILIFNENKSHIESTFTTADALDSLMKCDAPFLYYWLADKKKIRFFRLENDRLESDREKAFCRYKVTRKKLFIYNSYSEKWSKYNKNVSVYLRQ